MVAPLDRKLLRDLRHLVGQIVTIALVVACGVAAYVAARGTYESIVRARDAFYERYRFAHVFAQLERAPDALARDLQEIPGVARVETRVVRNVMLPLPWMTEPVMGTIVSLPVEGAPGLNAVYLRRGRMPVPQRDDEILVSESFADAHELALGDTLPVVINGKQREPRVVGVALSPEYVFPVSNMGPMPDAERYAIVWMSRAALAPAFEMEGAFNDVSMLLQPGASEEAVIVAVDRLLDRYGGLGAYDRDLQLSHRFVKGELEQLRTWATLVPGIFLAVAAFLVNVVLSRLVYLQRPEIAALKAMGYRDREIGLHYLELVAVIVVIGVALGMLFGQWSGTAFTDLYAEYFRFPAFGFELDARLLTTSVLVSAAAAVAGAFMAVRAVVRLPPAEAMRPPAPPAYRPVLIERLGARWLLGPAGRMVLRQLALRPLRFVLSAAGISMAVAIFILGRFVVDAVGTFMEQQFLFAQREDMSVTFTDPLPVRAVRELGHVPGVLRAEPLRTIPVRMRFEHRSRTTVLIGYPEELTLRQIVEWPPRAVQVPREGMLLTRALADVLRVRVGDSVQVEVLEGDRRVRSVRVAGLVDEATGTQGHMRMDVLHGLLDEEESASSALLRIDPARRDDVLERLKELPAVTGVARVDVVIERFREQTARSMSLISSILTLFAVTISVGVVYNNARVALSMRERELASLRVLGFTRAEISSILLGELAVQVLVGIPFGLVFGTWLAHGMMSLTDPELFRFPAVISSTTYALAVLVVIVAGTSSGLFVRHRLDHLDLIGVLKARE